MKPEQPKSLEMLQEVMHRLEHIVFTSHDTLEFVYAIQFQFMVRSVFWR